MQLKFVLIFIFAYWTTCRTHILPGHGSSILISSMWLELHLCRHFHVHSSKIYIKHCSISCRTVMSNLSVVRVTVMYICIAGGRAGWLSDAVREWAMGQEDVDLDNRVSGISRQLQQLTWSPLIVRGLAADCSALDCAGQLKLLLQVRNMWSLILQLCNYDTVKYGCFCMHFNAFIARSVVCRRHCFQPIRLCMCGGFLWLVCYRLWLCMLQ